MPVRVRHLVLDDRHRRGTAETRGVFGASDDQIGMEPLDDLERFLEVRRWRYRKLQLAKNGLRLALRDGAIPNDEHERGEAVGVVWPSAPPGSSAAIRLFSAL